MAITLEQRKAARDAAMEESIRASSTQDALKLIRGFEELDDMAARRGVWELTQNACDLTSRCEITLDFRNGELAFSHNGEPFTSKTLIRLIKQVSSKASGDASIALQKEEREQIGRFGTGFITTHAYGRHLLLNSSMAVDGIDAFIDLKDFSIDRRENNPETLLTSITQQQKRVYELLDEADYLPAPTERTTFRYVPTSEVERESVRQAWDSAVVNVPYVMALNEVLQQVRLIDEHGVERMYRKGVATEQNGVWYLPIVCNDETLVLPCLCKPNSTTQIIAPLGANNRAVAVAEKLPRLFLYFPLIGSEQWGCDFVMHSARFAPKNARDGVHLTLKNDQVRDKSERNRAVLLEASEIVFAFLDRQAEHIGEPVRLARVNFETGTEVDELEFRRELQAMWRERLAHLKLVETTDERLTPAECYFLSKELLRDEDALPSIQAVAQKLWSDLLPKQGLAQEWAKVLEEWQREETRWITPKELAAAIEDKKVLAAFNPEELLVVYQYLLKEEPELFEQFALLPNRRGMFVRRSELKRAQNLEPRFIEVLEKVLPTTVNRLVDEQFALFETLTPYTRRNLATQVNEEITGLLAADEGVLPSDTRKGLLLLCSIFSGEGTTVANGLRWQLMPYVHNFYEEEYQRIIIPNVAEEEEISYDAIPLRNMVKQFLADFRIKYLSESQKDREKRLPFLQTCLELLVANSDMRKDVLGTAVIFPNQLGELCAASDLQVEKGFGPSGSRQAAHAEQLKEWARLVVGVDFHSKLAHPDFVDLLVTMNRPMLEGKDFAGRIETLMAENQPLDRINDHPNKSEILAIIRDMSYGWNTYFPRIDGLKATIMMAMVSNATIKDNLFKIISLKPEQIAQLGELINADNLSELLAKAQDLLAAAQGRKADFAFKKVIGVGIEDLIRASVEDRIADVRVEVLEQQNGQDMVVRVGQEVVYRIEVKSRWQSGYSTTLSYRQLSTALEYSDRYSLCSVDLTDYWPTGEDKRHEVKDIYQIMRYIKFVPDIGAHISPLVGTLKQAEKDMEAVRLADEFRVVVPQRIIREGMSFEDFIIYLAKLL